MIGDKFNRAEFEAGMKNHPFDVVIDMISFNQEDAESTVRAFRDQADQIIFTSSIAAYKRPYHSVPTVEAFEELADDPEYLYGYGKAEMERYLQRVIREEKLPVTIVRPSLTYGVGAANIGVFRQNYGIVDRIRKGKPLIMFGDGTTPWNFTCVPDMARGFVALAGNKKAYGQDYHIANDDIHIWDDLYLEIGEIIGKPVEILHMPSEILYRAAPNLCNHLYFEKTYAGVFDPSKIKRDAPGFRTEVTLRDGLIQIIDWFEREANTVDPEKDLLEDRLAEIYHEMSDRSAQLYLK